MNKQMKRQVALLVILAMFITILPITLASDTKAAEYGVSNPCVSDGVSTWDCIYFGNYWQDDTNGDGTADKNDAKTPIKWRVLSVNGDDAFVVADKNLDVQLYSNEFEDVTWETCTMRSWLNGYGASSNACGIDYTSDNFFNNAFTTSEQSAILSTTVVNDDNPDYGTEGGNDTTDKVYLLSINEVTNTAYGFSDSFENSEMREAVNTAYVADGGEIDSLYMSGAGISDEWWLRSPGLYSFFASDVNSTGFVYRYGYDVYYNANAVRPALHLNLSSSSWSYASTVTSDGVVSEEATPVPTVEPTAAPSAMPGVSATPVPTIEPTAAPSAMPGVSATSVPSMSPTASPEPSERPITSTRPTTSPNSGQSDTVISPDSSTAVKAPAKVTKVTIKSKKGKLQAKWKKVTGANAYEICYSTSKKFTKEKKLTKNKSTKKTEITIKNLKRGKRYFVRVRAYTLQDGKKVYGKWSKVKKVKIR